MKKKIKCRVRPKEKPQELKVTRTAKPSIEQQIINIYLYSGENQFEEAKDDGREEDNG